MRTVIESLPLLHECYNQVEKKDTVTLKDLEGAYEVTSNMNLQGIYFKTYKAVKLFGNSYRFTRTTIVNDTVANREVINQFRDNEFSKTINKESITHATSTVSVFWFQR